MWKHKIIEDFTRLVPPRYFWGGVKMKENKLMALACSTVFYFDSSFPKNMGFVPWEDCSFPCEPILLELNMPKICGVSSKFDKVAALIFSTQNACPAEGLFNKNHIGQVMFFRYDKDIDIWKVRAFEYSLVKSLPGHCGNVAPVGVFDDSVYSVGENSNWEFDRYLTSFCNFFLQCLSCKNIYNETVKPDEKLNRSRIKKGKLPLFEYKILTVDLPGRKARTTYGCGAGTPQRVHLCRGHFKEYTKEKPLFGRLVGRYWWQPTVRGNGNGVIDKEYHVNMRGTDNAHRPH